MKYAAAPATATAYRWRAYYRDKKTTDQRFIQLLESYTAGSVESNLETMLRRVSVNGGRLTDMVTDYVSGVRTAILRFSLSGEQVDQTVTRTGMHPRTVVKVIVETFEKCTDELIARPFRTIANSTPPPLGPCKTPGGDRIPLL